jgi:hypothetical protein
VEEEKVTITKTDFLNYAYDLWYDRTIPEDVWDKLKEVSKS